MPSFISTHKVNESVSHYSLQTKIGLLAALLLLGAAVSTLLWSRGVVHQPTGAFVRIGFLLALLWLAWNDLARVPRWIWWFFPVILLVAAFRPYYLFIVVPAMLFLLILWPKRKKK